MVSEKKQQNPCRTRDIVLFISRSSSLSKPDAVLYPRLQVPTRSNWTQQVPLKSGTQTCPEAAKPCFYFVSFHYWSLHFISSHWPLWFFIENFLISYIWTQPEPGAVCNKCSYSKPDTTSVPYRLGGSTIPKKSWSNERCYSVALHKVQHTVFL